MGSHLSTGYPPHDCGVKMKFVLAPDSFKETMSASEVASIMSAGIRSVFPDAECVEVPMADGGEGTTESLIDALGGRPIWVEVSDALGRPRQACFGWVESKRLAIVEIAEAVGIEHLTPDERDPHKANSRGVGHLLNHVLELKPRRLIVGLGGSAINDGGWGMAKELGVSLVDENGADVDCHALSLRNAKSIDTSHVDHRWAEIDVVLACDVDNPLTGDRGATAVFGPQKGVKPEELELFDEALSCWGTLLDLVAGASVSDQAGAGAAGGLGAAFMSILGAKPRRGVEVVMETVQLSEKISGADFVFTGEGSMDFQTRFGKTPWGVMLAAKEQGVPTIAFTGNLGEGAQTLQEDGFVAVIPTVRKVAPLDEVLATAQPSLFETVCMACRVIAAARKNIRF